MSTHFGREGGSYTGTYKVTLEPYLRDQSGEPAELIAPGVTETSRIAVRFATPVDWIDTLEPYRQYFRGRFGSVRYQADRRPVWGEAISTVQHIGKNPGGTSYPNPRGFNAYRADRNGWGPFVDMVLRDVIPRGYERIMLWNPSGMYSTGQNFPVEFMTEWSPEMADSVAELDRLKAAGVTIGMWWGHAGHVSGGFNSGQLWVRDTSNPADLAAGDAELDLAAQRRTDEVGLDSVVALPLWDRYPWMLRNLQRYPSLRYVTEHHDTDIMHTIAPTYLSPWSWWNQPAVLADWLNPGHETWVQLWWNEVTAEVVEQILDYGMVPVTMTTAIDLTARPCTYSLQPSASAFGLEGGAGSIAIATSGATCDWVVRSGASWITITGSTAGRGSGTIRFSVAPTSGSTGRTGTVTVATRTVGISQLAPPTIAVTSPTTASEFSAEGSTVSLAGSVSGDTGVSVSWASDLGQTGVASVRVGPDTMTWTAPAIPLHSGANTLTLTATDAAGNRASRVVTVNARSMVYYLAEGATAGTFDTDVHLANPNPVPAPVKVTCLREDGTTVVTAYTIPAFGQLTVHLDDIPLLGSTAVGTVVESSAGVPLIVERSMFW